MGDVMRTVILCLMVLMLIAGVCIGRQQAWNDNYNGVFASGYDVGCIDGRLEGMKLRFAEIYDR